MNEIWSQGNNIESKQALNAYLTETYNTDILPAILGITSS